MDFNLKKSIEILEQTPKTLTTMLGNLSTDWTSPNEGPDTWSVYDIVGHLIHGEKTDWIPRMEIILSDKPDKSFEAFNRFAQFDEDTEAGLRMLLNQFKDLRQENIRRLISKDLKDADLKKTGVHPSFGEITLAHLLSTWVVHDLNHIAQISRVMARQYKGAVGPWTPYLKILQS